MSSRVRLMLQDFVLGTAHVGSAAWRQLLNLYQIWEKAQTAERKTTRKIWKPVTPAYGEAHRLTCANLTQPFDGVLWEGPGWYRESFEVLTTPGKKLAPLPTGPRWQVALEMWSRLRETHSSSYALFLSRDNRKHAWRKSLCNPFYQQFGWKARKTAPKKMKAVPTRTTPVRGYGGWEDNSRPFEIPPLPRTPRTEQPKQAPMKPRVGIWS